MMATRSERDGHPKGNDHINDIAPYEKGHSQFSQVLETMWHLIIEIKGFKADNEKLKKDHENQ